jgi:nicotinate dehydrogenase subunit A
VYLSGYRYQAGYPAAQEPLAVSGKGNAARLTAGRAPRENARRRQEPLPGEDAMAHIGLTVNGRRTRLTVDDPDAPLLYVLRNDLGLHGPRFGCGLGQCGACTVHVDGKAVRSCSVPVSSVANRKVVTLEGLGTPQKPHPLQKAFIEEQAAQCGYCINGMIMQSAAFLATNKNPSEDQIKQALADNLCRCGTHSRILRAVKRAAAGI